MERISIHLENPHVRTIQAAVAALEKGELVVYPTDTLYGIGCSIYQKKAIEQLYRLKGKSKFEPMSLICGSIRQAAEYTYISNFAFRVLKRCFPGPFTVVLQARKEIARLMLSRRMEIGVRIPEALVCRQLVEQLGHPILNSSVVMEEQMGMYGEMSLDPDIEEAAALLLDAGPLPEFRESTVVRILDNEIEVIREGRGPLDVLRQ